MRLAYALLDQPHRGDRAKAQAGRESINPWCSQGMMNLPTTTVKAETTPVAAAHSDVTLRRREEEAHKPHQDSSWIEARTALRNDGQAPNKQ